MIKKCEFCKQHEPVSYVSEYDAFICEGCFCEKIEKQEKIQKQIDDFEICPKCFTPYDREDYKTVYESVPYGSTTASYPVDIGVKCHNCGYEEDF